MADIVIHPLGERRFRVEVHEAGRHTTHEVSVPERLGEGIALPDNLATVVERSFEFLLEREPPSSILSRFSLSEISRYFPEYTAELARRLA